MTVEALANVVMSELTFIQMWLGLLSVAYIVTLVMLVRKYKECDKLKKSPKTIGYKHLYRW